MKQSMFITRLRGYVRIQIRGSECERLINPMMEKGFSIWDIQATPEGKLECNILIKDFFRLKPLLKRTGCRMHVLERYGLPFFMERLGRRKFFFGGMAAFIIGIYVLTSFVWQISVEGNDRITDAQILEAASKQGIHLFQWKLKLKKTEELSRDIQSLLPSTAWVGVEIRGTHVTIKVVEATIPDPRKLMNPRNLVASKNALVTEIISDKGKPLVKPNTYVRKGDVLISGTIGDEQNNQVVVAEGKVKGVVWYTSRIEAPLTKTYKVYTGETANRNYLVWGTRALQLSGYGKMRFEHFETIPERKTIAWRSWALPVGWLHEKVMEMNLVEEPIEAANARKSGLEQARAKLLAASGADARLVGEKILHEKTENGKIYIDVHFEVEENIAEEQPIVIRGE
ncbi:sporulation protein YqfD [Paenibacillus marchantiophytorum]|uniref:Sporulation protein YqfD n=1 Tax=Paenibacillus marchantiophytorum TaxID=1619310 RepID=A0ABQ2BMX8_9BACL|nr:sporulation protein YqfD [Paenibacillus marchantiophytorum]GGI43461.1 sporulation protein YqfD [Paenibacillus marchantiophytorum]